MHHQAPVHLPSHTHLSPTLQIWLFSASPTAQQGPTAQHTETAHSTKHPYKCHLLHKMHKCTAKNARLGMKLVRQWRTALRREKSSIRRSCKEGSNASNRQSQCLLQALARGAEDSITWIFILTGSSPQNNPAVQSVQLQGEHGLWPTWA